MKSNKTVKLSFKKDLGVVLALCIIMAVIALSYLIVNWSVEVWGTVFAFALVCILLCILGIRACLVVDMENRVIIRRVAFKKTIITFHSIKSVEMHKTFLGKEIHIIGNDGRLFDKSHVVLFTANYISPENFVAYFSSGCCDGSLLLPSKRLEKKQGMISKIALSVVAFVELGIFVYILILELKNSTPAYPIVDIKWYGYGLFWVIAFIIVATLIGLLVKNRHNAITDFIMIVLFFGFMPMALIGAFATSEDYYVSATKDFENFDDIVKEQWNGNYNHFPKEINGEVCDFSYYYKYYWDSVHEVYLEIKYDDEEFGRIYSEYEEKEESYLGAQYEEVNLGEEWLNAEKYDDGEVYISHAYFKKIIFDKENNTVIYYLLSVTDPFDLEWCHLSEKFDVDFMDYEEYIKEKKEKTNQDS